MPDFIMYPSRMCDERNFFLNHSIFGTPRIITLKINLKKQSKFLLAKKFPMVMLNQHVSHCSMETDGQALN
jgi:hypothetical protein